MTVDLQKVKERLIKEGVVNDVKYYESENELAINEDYFIYDQETGESDLYYISVTTDKDNTRYIVDTCFAERDFLDRYDNQEEYVRNLIEEMNQELNSKKYNNKLDVNQVFNAKFMGEYMIKNILEKHIKDSDLELFWLAEEISDFKGDIYKVYTEEQVSKVFERAYNKDKEATLEYINYLLEFKDSYNENYNEVVLDAIVCQTIEGSSSSCYWNNYACKFMPREMLKDVLYTLSSIDTFNKVRVVKNENEEYIEVTLKNNQKVMVLTEEHDNDVFYTATDIDSKSCYKDVKTLYTLDRLISFLEDSGLAF